LFESTLACASWFPAMETSSSPSFAVLNEAIESELKVRSAVLDGEIVCLDAGGKPQFRDLLFHRGDPRFVAFDLLWCEGPAIPAN